MVFRTGIFTLLILLDQSINAQEVKGVVVDQTTKKSIPFATISSLNNYAIANEQGQFKLSPKPYNTNDSILFQVMGYLDLKLPIKMLGDSIYMVPNPIELEEVILVNNQYLPEDLIEKVKASFKKNYSYNLERKRIFLRESTYDSIEDFQMNLLKSTYNEINEELIDELKASMPTKSNFFVETLFDLYGTPQEGKNKVEVIKGSVLRDENNTVDSDIIERKMGLLLQKKTSLGSYFKLKSGIFSAKLETDDFTLETKTDSVKPKAKTESQLQKERKSYARNRAQIIERFSNELFYSEDSFIDVFDKSQRYEFEIIDLKLRGDEFIYTLSFAPKRGSGFKGKMMINAADAAVEMINYQNTSNLKSFSLFGFKFKDYLALGTQVFRKNSFGTYDLVFLQESRGKLASIERPLKLIEKRKTGSWKRKQNEVSFEFSIRLSNIETKEYMLIDKSPIRKSEYENFKPIFKVDKVRLDAFDPHFWDGYSILEPNDLLREFKIQ
ncbi:MAG: hypothetical protein HWD84_05950 [Flavobacteriaceae bacterium]|jgi:hypothetical protein|nr:hypothetical protein [Flavobacteriaceae bacterium]NVJ72469.1 hypothetical protein [Flavobacteriaceae bacterium]